MSGLFANLSSAAAAMRTQTVALDVIGRNMANANNPAYARQRIVLGDRGTVQTPQGAQSLGTEVIGVTQFRDRLLDGQISREIAAGSRVDTQLNFLRQAQNALGGGLFGQSGGIETIGTNPATATGLPAAIDDFFNAFEAFAANPTGTVEKQQVIRFTDELVARLQTADSRLADLSLPSAAGNTLTRQMDVETDVVNGLLTTIADLNRQIGRVELVNPGSAVDLRDQRQAKIEELSKHIDFSPVQQVSGQVGIQVRDSANNPVDLVSLATVGGTLARNGSDYEFTPASGPAVTLNITGGSLRGLQDAGAAIGSYRAGLDTFTQALVSGVNTAYNSATNGDFFAAGGTTAGTIARSATASSLRATDIGGPAGANDVANAVAALARDAGFLDGTPSQAFGRIVSTAAQELSATEARSEDQKTLLAFLLSSRDSLGGVSLDEEAADMMRVQRAFQANARLMQVMDELLDQIVNGLVR